MGGRSLTVLMWKHMMVRKRRFLRTAVELTAPIMFVLLVFIFSDIVNPKGSIQRRSYDDNIKLQDTKMIEDVTNYIFVLYSPENKLTHELMDEVGRQLGMTRKEALGPKLIDKSKELLRRGYYGASNYSEVAMFAEEIYANEAIIIFENLQGEVWPDKLVYTIRTKQRYNTYTYKSQDQVPNNHNAFGIVYDEFIKLQWAVDTSYIHVRTANNVTQRLSIQEFPYYRSMQANHMEELCQALRISCWLSLFIGFVFLMSRLLEEKSSGIQELVQMVGVSSNTLGISHFLNVIPAGLVYAGGNTLLVKVGAHPIIPHSDGLVIAIVLALHFVSVVAMAMALSYAVDSTQFAVSLSVFAYILLFLPLQLVSHFSPSRSGIIMLSGILPHIPMFWLWTEINEFEQYDIGLSFSDITTSHSPTSGPVLLGCAWLLVQCFFSFTLAWYLSHVRPGKYGQPKPWNFLFTKQYWSRNEIQPHTSTEEEEPIARDKKYFEDMPKDHEVGIRIENVSKIFPKHKALSNVSLEVYKGEITILLGHNGAGKTTLMSIITGMMSATEGKVYVNGMDSVVQRDKVRSQLGLCPQHNLFFPDLTVLEHVQFFSLLKGGTYFATRQSAMKLLERLGIANKAHSMSSKLSGGMKRRLQLACALAGGASVLVLDEPTSGLDVETRRELWDLLLSLRGDRTVLLTTHFMEEADALGDRVAALHMGQLRCHATNMYLKKAIGTGYRLSLTTNGVPRDAPITSVVTSFVPDASLREKTINSLSYSLPAAGSSHFPKLFTELEGKRSELGIESIGVGVSTLEEVFLKLCSDTDTAFNEDEVDTARVEPTYNKVTGFALYGRQFCVLFKRQFKYVTAKKSAFFLLQVFIPVLMIILFTVSSDDQPQEDVSDKKLSMDLDMYIPLPERRVLYKVDEDSVDQAWFRSLDSPGLKYANTENITDTVLRTGMHSLVEYNKYLAGIEMNSTDAKALFTTVYRHAAPVAVNLISNLIASRYISPSDGRTITTYNQPIYDAASYNPKVIQPKSTMSCTMWSVIIVIILLSTNVNFASLVCRERVSGSRHIHIMAGCPAALHWLTTLTFHSLAALLLVVVIVVACLAIDTNETFTQTDMLLTLCVILVLGNLAFFSLMYLMSFHFAERATGIIMSVIMVLFGLITPLITTAIGIFESQIHIMWRILLNLSSWLMPPHAMVIATVKCVFIARLNAMCTLNKQLCPNIDVNEQQFDVEKCCAGEKQQNYIASTEYSPLGLMLLLTGQLGVYMILVVLSQKGVLNRVNDAIFNARVAKKASVPSSDEIVRAEAVFVSKQIELPSKQIQDANVAMLVDGVHKRYHRTFGKSCYAVQGLSFSVKKGECFGLLGVNGAGKSTTFKMLTAEVCATRGGIYANGHYIKKNKNLYLRSLGYCPQFFGLDEFQTGRDNLTLLLTLRGLDSADVTKEVTQWIAVVGLEKYSERLVSGYSGGCTRRLGAAAALASGAPLTLLDEPTAGVDVAARRKVWTALRRSLKMQRSVVITSHSMDEMEALCSRIGIMSGGTLRALGTPAELRARHAQGHAVVIKVKHSPGAGAGADDVDSASSSELNSLKSSLQTKFNCTLKDEHKTMLHYHINDTLRYSALFAELETLKTTFPTLIEDYSVTETTLEEVFLSFAKETRDTPTQTNGLV